MPEIFIEGIQFVKIIPLLGLSSLWIRRIGNQLLVGLAGGLEGSIKEMISIT